MICIDELNKIVANELSGHRLQHVYGVVETAKELANIYDVDPQKAEIAALFHDLYKKKSVDEMNSLIKKWNLDEKYIDNPSLAHSKLAAYAMKNLYKIKDQDLINAVAYHTTGRKDMSKLEKIIYLADGIEPNRHYDGVEENRKIAKYDLNKACLVGIESTIKKLKKMGQTEETIDKDTLDAREYFKKEIKKEN